MRFQIADMKYVILDRRYMTTYVHRISDIRWTRWTPIANALVYPCHRPCIQMTQAKNSKQQDIKRSLGCGHLGNAKSTPSHPQVNHQLGWLGGDCAASQLQVTHQTQWLGRDLGPPEMQVSPKSRPDLSDLWVTCGRRGGMLIMMRHVMLYYSYAWILIVQTCTKSIHKSDGIGPKVPAKPDGATHATYFTTLMICMTDVGITLHITVIYDCNAQCKALAQPNDL